MKSLFKFLILSYLTRPCIAAPYVLITYEGDQRSYLERIHDVMGNHFQVSTGLYELEHGPCEKREAVATHICIDQKKNIKVIYRNEKIMEDMLGVYWK